MKNKAFSYIEIIISLFIFTITLIPALKLNSNHFKTYKLISNYDSERIFLSSLLSYLKTEKIFLEKDENYIINNFSELKSNNLFKNFNLTKEIEEDFILEIDVKKETINFYIKQIETNIYKISFKKEKKNFQVKLIKFKE